MGATIVIYCRRLCSNSIYLPEARLVNISCIAMFCHYCKLAWPDDSIGGPYLEFDHFCIHQVTHMRQTWIKGIRSCPVSAKACFANFLQGFDRLIIPSYILFFMEQSCRVAGFAKIFNDTLQNWYKLTISVSHCNINTIQTWNKLLPTWILVIY